MCNQFICNVCSHIPTSFSNPCSPSLIMSPESLSTERYQRLFFQLLCNLWCALPGAPESSAIYFTPIVRAHVYFPHTIISLKFLSVVAKTNRQFWHNVDAANVLTPLVWSGFICLWQKRVKNSFGKILALVLFSKVRKCKWTHCELARCFWSRVSKTSFWSICAHLRVSASWRSAMLRAILSKLSSVTLLSLAFDQPG